MVGMSVFHSADMIKVDTKAQWAQQLSSRSNAFSSSPIPCNLLCIAGTNTLWNKDMKMVVFTQAFLWLPNVTGMSFIFMHINHCGQTVLLATHALALMVKRKLASFLPLVLFSYKEARLFWRRYCIPRLPRLNSPWRLELSIIFPKWNWPSQKEMSHKWGLVSLDSQVFKLCLLENRLLAPKNGFNGTASGYSRKASLGDNRT